MVVGQVVDVGGILEESFAIVEIHPDHERLRFGGGVSIHAGHETASGLEYWSPVVPYRGFDVRQPQGNLFDCREGVPGFVSYRAP